MFPNSYLINFSTGRVGKTSLLLRYINNAYTDKQPSTIQAHFLSKRLVINDERITLNVWVRFNHLFVSDLTCYRTRQARKSFTR